MLANVVRIVPIVVGLAALLVAGVALSAPRGKVVRVERNRARTGSARYCVIMDTPEKLLCIGSPKIGEPVTYLDTRNGGVIGELQVDSIQASRMYGCPGREATLFDVTGTLTRGDRDVIARGYTLALRGVALGARARVLEDYRSPTQTEQSVVAAVDADGDDAADIVLTMYTCDAQGVYQPGGSSQTQCYDTYSSRGGQLVRTHQDIIELCY